MFHVSCLMSQGSEKMSGFASVGRSLYRCIVISLFRYFSLATSGGGRRAWVGDASLRRWRGHTCAVIVLGLRRRTWARGAGCRPRPPCNPNEYVGRDISRHSKRFHARTRAKFIFYSKSSPIFLPRVEIRGPLFASLATDAATRRDATRRDATRRLERQ